MKKRETQKRVSAVEVIKMNGKWIWLNHEVMADSYADFMDKFTYADGQCKIRISCDSNYALWVNGVLVGGSQYSDYPWHKFFNEHDITKYLKKGENTIELTVWYYGVENFSYYVGKPCLRYEVSVGDTLLACSSENTLARKGKGYREGMQKWITSQLGFSFEYDLRDTGCEYTNALVVDIPCEALEVRPIQNVQVGAKKEAVETGKSTYVYDLGAESVGYLSIEFFAKSGTVLNIAYGEHLENGHVKRKIHSRDFSVELIANGEKTEYVNPFRRIGGRYLEVTADGEFEVYSIGLLPTEYPFVRKQFTPSTAHRNIIYQTAVRTLELCFHEHYEDCPWREQGLYGMDSRNQMLFGYYAFNNPECPRASLELFSLHCDENGLLPICSPTSHPQAGIPCFSLFYIVAMKEYIEYTGDTSLAEKYYATLDKMIGYFTGRVQDGLFALDNSGKYWNFYEWSDNMWGAPEIQVPTDCMINCILSYALDNMAYICKRLQKHETAEQYLSIRDTLNANIKKTFYNEQTGTFQMFVGNYETEAVNAMAIVCGAANGEVAEKLAEIIAEGKMENKCTLSVKAFKYDALLKVNKEKYAKVVLDDIEGVYTIMLNAGATSFWETELGAADFDGAGSLCHGWSALPAYYYQILKG